MNPAAHIAVAGRDDDDETVANTVRHSDRVLVVVDADTYCDVSAIADLVRHDLDPLAAPTLELILLHDARAEVATGTARWLAGCDYAHHLHLREGSAEDLARFSRHVAGRSVGLVLGGGGARGLAHIGVLRALKERSIPVDSVGGSSIGAILGAQLAMGWTWEAMLERNERFWHDRRLRWDFTLPTVSLFSGRGSARVFDEVLGDRRDRGLLAAVPLHHGRSQRVQSVDPPQRTGRPSGSAPAPPSPDCGPRSSMRTDISTSTVAS